MKTKGCCMVMSVQFRIIKFSMTLSTKEILQHSVSKMVQLKEYPLINLQNTMPYILAGQIVRFKVNT